ncbi:MAG: hypothetical protein UV82_C0006G0070 [Candidatus Magasanikbacteria bacterium GW2011_GWD2_43_18]|uniref:Uncharacterized protein n=1 Tax=Candidatus Magasanikbacteria bacterium GW2011_GWE2_42_7 TaxID=1619052 RepID=A0A0G1BFJ9_9BACT|nr:MAG: hypothetical protein UV18_C0005G0016 [Candidatus Magasanikbacteria bacterium GW2011_GWC2_42_27]KKS72077.1 MAG: hypothetical protein UV42_C0014G0016 [Candidatus Magasanikbacteria bacterium GW2011_GWE2_42_7]KKT04714.1 MAG: hypothetical protein UV82_C0006G0070 [Candidatus Magasanikbacteria bacterium GW2011_GWD2_43_18]KKT24978.1 MAG: hypothetical protein UW10_C0016G0011 [Candidatus Magasanikbacteria bacterium GW2011_GWA2_43_9]
MRRSVELTRMQAKLASPSSLCTFDQPESDLLYEVPAVDFVEDLGSFWDYGGMRTRVLPTAASCLRAHFCLTISLRTSQTVMF